ncbi:MAG TPA: hypothetical protein VLA89_03560, partial [Gemmatimonadales bacterium]|nr:hypothetical protein [Gemmatimonadales bacterium]
HGGVGVTGFCTMDVWTTAGLMTKYAICFLHMEIRQGHCTGVMPPPHVSRMQPGGNLGSESNNRAIP